MKNYLTDAEKERMLLDKLKNKPIKEYPDNEPYLLLKEEAFKLSGFLNSVEVSAEKISTVLDYLVYLSEGVTISLRNDVGFLRFKSRANSVDISRVWVRPDCHGQKQGTILMCALLYCIQNILDKLDYFPKIVLECNGSVGFFENHQETPVELQIKFFEKFGFEVVRTDDYYSTHMQLNKEKMMAYMNQIEVKD